MHNFQRPVDQLRVLLCLAEASGERTCFCCICTGLKPNSVMAMVLLLYDCFAIFSSAEYLPVQMAAESKF